MSAVPPTVGTGGPTSLPVAFARLVRGLGVEVPIGAVTDYARALALVGLGTREGVYWAGRATLVRRLEDVPRYEQAFAAFWLGEHLAPAPVPAPVEVPVVVESEDEEEPAGEQDESGEERPVLAVRYSPTETLRQKDFAACTAAELAEAQRLMATIGLRPATRRSRRRRPTGGGRRPDLRRTVRQALRDQGEPFRRAWWEPGQRARRVVLLLDVSGSMEPYARALLRFAHVAVVGGARVEAFTLGTRLTRVTRELSEHDPDAALARAAGAVGDWSGGTRLGEGLRRFNDLWGVRGMARGAIVVVCSDGWDRGDPELLGAEMARLHRVTHRVVWVNPLKASPGYAPLARGMAADLPSVDAFVEVHSLESLGALAEVIGQ